MIGLGLLETSTLTGFEMLAAEINFSKIAFAFSGVILALRTFLPGAEMITFTSSTSGFLATLSITLRCPLCGGLKEPGNKAIFLALTSFSASGSPALNEVASPPKINSPVILVSKSSPDSLITSPSCSVAGPETAGWSTTMLFMITLPKSLVACQKTAPSIALW